MKISCVIPAHNEEGNIEILIHKLINVLEARDETKDYEIVLVDDSSTDSTPSIVDKLAGKNARIVALHRKEKPGFGYAIKDGFNHASGDVIIPVMGDLSDDPEDIPKLVEKILEGYDVVYGSRFVKGGKTEGYPISKKIANRVFNNLARLLFRVPHKDITNAFKAYHRRVIDEILDCTKSSGFDITAELPLRAHMSGFKSVEVPVRWYARRRGEAKLKLRMHAFVYGKRLLRLLGSWWKLSLRRGWKKLISKSENI